MRYIEGTETLLWELLERKIVETREVGENLLIGLDGDGKIVSLTIEHAIEHIDVLKISYEWIRA